MGEKPDPRTGEYAPGVVHGQNAVAEDPRDHVERRIELAGGCPFVKAFDEFELIRQAFLYSMFEADEDRGTIVHADEPSAEACMPDDRVLLELRHQSSKPS